MFSSLLSLYCSAVSISDGIFHFLPNKTEHQINHNNFISHQSFLFVNTEQVKTGDLYFVDDLVGVENSLPEQVNWYLPCSNKCFRYQRSQQGNLLSAGGSNNMCAYVPKTILFLGKHKKNNFIGCFFPKQGRDLAILSACNATILSYGTYGFWGGFLAGGGNGIRCEKKSKD